MTSKSFIQVVHSSSQWVTLDGVVSHRDNLFSWGLELGLGLLRDDYFGMRPIWNNHFGRYSFFHGHFVLLMDNLSSSFAGYSVWASSSTFFSFLFFPIFSYQQIFAFLDFFSRVSWQTTLWGTSFSLLLSDSFQGDAELIFFCSHHPTSVEWLNQMPMPNPSKIHRGHPTCWDRVFYFFPHEHSRDWKLCRIDEKVEKKNDPIALHHPGLPLPLCVMPHYSQKERRRLASSCPQEETPFPSALPPKGRWGSRDFEDF